MSVGVMKDYKLKQRDLRASHTLGWSGCLLLTPNASWCGVSLIFFYLRKRDVGISVSQYKFGQENKKRF